MGLIKNTDNARPQRKKTLIVIFLGLAVLVAAVGLIAFLSGVLKFTDTGSAPETTNDDETNRQKEIRNGQIADLEKKIGSASTKDAASIHSELANLYANTDDNKGKSIGHARDLVDLKKDAASYSQLGFAYSVNGENELAAKAYAQAAKLSEPKTDDGRSDYSYYKDQAAYYKKKAGGQ